MKKVVETIEVEGEGLESLLGQNVVLFCMNYIYAGKLVGVNKTCVLLQEAGIVYETGGLCDKAFKNFQPLPFQHYVQTAAIESFGLSGK